MVDKTPTPPLCEWLWFRLKCWWCKLPLEGKPPFD